MKKVRLILGGLAVTFLVSACELVPTDIQPLNPNDVVLEGDMSEPDIPMTPPPPPMD